MICGRNCLWYHFIRRLFEPENYQQCAQEGLKSWIMEFSYTMAYGVPMFDELYMVGCDIAYCLSFG